jgi:hypothetical protein
MTTITIYKIAENMVFGGDVEIEVADAVKSPIPAGHTRVSPHPIPDRHYAVMQGGWQYVEGEPPVYPDPVAVANEQAANIRSQRNTLLSESDWTQLVDAVVNQEAWAAYRQALRDIPQQEGFPSNVVWPEKP